jgi:hypothetical protein
MTNTERARELGQAIHTGVLSLLQWTAEKVSTLILAELQAQYSAGYNAQQGDLAKLLQAERKRAIEECKDLAREWVLGGEFDLAEALDDLKE